MLEREGSVAVKVFVRQLCSINQWHVGHLVANILNLVAITLQQELVIS